MSKKKVLQSKEEIKLLTEEDILERKRLLEEKMRRQAAQTGQGG